MSINPIPARYCFGLSVTNLKDSWSVRLFSKLNEIWSGYFDPINIIFDGKINTFSGDLADVSAKTRTLLMLQ